MATELTRSAVATCAREDRVLRLLWASLPVWFAGSAVFGAVSLVATIVALSGRWLLVFVPAAAAGAALAGLCGARSRTLDTGAISLRDLLPRQWTLSALSSGVMVTAAVSVARLDVPAAARGALLVVTVGTVMVGLMVVLCESLVPAEPRDRIRNGLAIAVHEPALAIRVLGSLAAATLCVIVTAGALVAVAPAVWAIAGVNRTHRVLSDFPGYETGAKR